MYALGVVDCDNMLMLLGVSQKFTEQERDVVVPLLIQGFMVSAAGIMSLQFILTLLVSVYPNYIL